MSPFAVLGLAPTLDIANIKAAYFEALRRWPPEQHPARFKDVRGAYEALLSEDGRRAAVAHERGDDAAVLERFRAEEQASLLAAKDQYGAQSEGATFVAALFDWASRNTVDQVLAQLSSGAPGPS